MGLAGPRKRTKISHDPNNTSWSRSTSNFGHKILTSQGWTPGSFLGARNAAHADMFTAASTSNIKVTLKDDTLGLGARPRRDPLNELTGLDAFKGLLGRLNGKNDVELQAEQRQRDDVKLARYAATKWQSVRFVSGGLLVQEKLETAAREHSKTQKRQSTSVTVVSNENLSLQHENATASGDLEKSTGKDSTERTKKKRRRAKSPTFSEGEEKRKRKKSKKRQLLSESESLVEEGSQTGLQSAPAEKEPVTQAATAAPRERLPQGRHVFRGRHIAQKKKALLDDKSLNEIFMIKT